MIDTKLEVGNEIFLTTHIGMATPSFFEIVKNSDKAVQLKNSNHKMLWLPKSSIKWDDKFHCFFVTDWFRRKMEVWQLSFLQS